jgi:hypothetical protein
MTPSCLGHACFFLWERILIFFSGFFILYWIDPGVPQLLVEAGASWVRTLTSHKYGMYPISQKIVYIASGYFSVKIGR